MKRYSEVQALVDEFRIQVISAILSAYPGRAIDNDDPTDNIFLMDGVPVRVEADRIVVGGDLDNYIPLKDAPRANHPPRYRDVDSILVDFKAYVDAEKKDVKSYKVKEPFRVPGTSIVLESNDLIYYPN